MNLSIDRGTWLIGLVWLSIVAAAAYLTFVLLRAHFDEDVEGRALSARQVILAQIHQAGWSYAEDDELWVFELPYVRGVEVFASDGRRIWGAGEPLEIVGYKLNRDSPLVHRTSSRMAREFYWPANLLTGDQGIAVRVDIGVQKAAVQQLRNRLLIVYGAIFVLLGIIVMQFVKRCGRPAHDE